MANLDPIPLDEHMVLEFPNPALAEELNGVYKANPHLSEFDSYYTDRIDNLELIRAGQAKVRDRVLGGLSLTCYGRYDGELALSVAFGLFTEDHAAVIGYWAAKKYEGRGFVTRLSRRILAAGFLGGGFNPEPKIDTVWAELHPDNTRSHNVNTALGFVSAVTAGMPYPSTIPPAVSGTTLYVLTREAWSAAQNGMIPDFSRGIRK